MICYFIIDFKKYNMANQQNDKKQEDNKKSSKPEPETLHETDPQEDMKGPVSSFMQTLKKVAEKNDGESKEEANRRKDENT